MVNSTDQSQTARWSKSLSLILLFALAIVVRVFGAFDIAFGDEPNTLTSTENLGANLQSLPYFVLNHLWLSISDSIMWLRIPSIILGSLAVVVCWLWLEELGRDRKVIWLTCILLIFSSPAVTYAQQIRFYSYFMLTGTLFLWAYTHYLQKERLTRREWATFGLATLLFFTAHFLAFIPIIFFAMHWLYFNTRINLPYHRRIFWILLVVGIVGAAIIAIIPSIDPQIYEPGYRFMHRVVNGPANAKGNTFEYEAPRGWSWIALAKQVILAFQLIFGSYVYPFQVVVIILGILSAIALLLGFLRIERSKQGYMVVVIASVLILFNIFDSLLPSSFAASATDRHVIWGLPILLWLIAEGCFVLPVWGARVVLVVGIIGAQIYGFWGLVEPQWDYVAYEDLIDSLEEVTTTEPNTLLVFEPSISGIIDINADTQYEWVSLWDYTETALEFEVDSLAVAASARREENWCNFSAIYAGLPVENMTRALVRYPAFFYVYDQSTVNEQQMFNPPPTLYSPRYLDLALPQTVQWTDSEFDIVGGYTLPDCARSKQWSREFDQPQRVTTGLLLASSVYSSKSLPKETVVAELTLHNAATGETVHFPLRISYETNQLEAKSCAGECQRALTWHKKIQLRGQQSYSGVYDDFDASIWSVALPVSEPLEVDAITLELTRSDIEFVIWGIFPLPAGD